MRRLLLGLCCVCAGCLWAQNVSNVQTTTKHKTIEISYYVDDLADISVQIYLNNRLVTANTLSGDVGKNISAGTHTIVWDVLKDRTELQGEITCKVTASTATRTIEQMMAKQERAAARAKRMSVIHPIAGMDVHAGYAGIGLGVFWPWVSGPSRVGSYASWTMGFNDWYDEDVVMFNNIFFGAQVRLTEHMAWFVAPGLSIVDYDYDGSSDGYSYSSRISDYFFDNYYSDYNSSSSSSSSVTETSYRFAVETGLEFRILCFALSFRVNYPWYVGVGLGFDFGY